MVVGGGLGGWGGGGGGGGDGDGGGGGGRGERDCQLNMGHAVIGYWLSDSAISVVSTRFCLLDLIFISFVDPF